jgi:hypothetical protein
MSVPDGCEVKVDNSGRPVSATFFFSPPTKEIEERADDWDAMEGTQPDPNSEDEKGGQCSDGSGGNNSASQEG